NPVPVFLSLLGAGDPRKGPCAGAGCFIARGPQGCDACFAGAATRAAQAGGRSPSRNACGGDGGGVKSPFCEPPIELLAAPVAWQRWCLRTTLRVATESAEDKAKIAIAMLQEGLRDFDLQCVARASTELDRTAGPDSESRNRALHHGRNLATSHTVSSLNK